MLAGYRMQSHPFDAVLEWPAALATFMISAQGKRVFVVSAKDLASPV